MSLIVAVTVLKVLQTKRYVKLIRIHVAWTSILYENISDWDFNIFRLFDCIYLEIGFIPLNATINNRCRKCYSMISLFSRYFQSFFLLLMVHWTYVTYPSTFLINIRNCNGSMNCKYMYLRESAKNFLRM